MCLVNLNQIELNREGKSLITFFWTQHGNSVTKKCLYTPKPGLDDTKSSPSTQPTLVPVLSGILFSFFFLFLIGG